MTSSVGELNASPAPQLDYLKLLESVNNACWNVALTYLATVAQACQGSQNAALCAFLMYAASQKALELKSECVIREAFSLAAAFALLKAVSRLLASF